jgi:lauroyl/myristoyl acyltransferase
LDVFSEINEVSLSPEYALVRANISHFIPQLAPNTKEIFLGIKDQKKEFRDPIRSYVHQLTYEKRSSEPLSELVKPGPVIFVSFHMGPVGPLLSYISDREIDFKLLLDDFHFEKWSGFFQSVYREYTDKKKLRHPFEVLNAEDPLNGLAIADAVRNGSSLLLYMDGNTGAGGANRQDSKLCQVDFLGKQIFARKGVAHLSRTFNAPIIPAVCYFEKRGEELNYVLEFCNPIFPDRSIPKKQFVKDTTQKLYSILEEYVLRYPDQWEGWLYFHQFIDKSKAENKEAEVSINDESLPLRFNDALYSFVLQNGDYFLFNQNTYQYSAITPDVYKFLSGLQKPEIIPQAVSTDSVIGLLKKGILIKT